MIDPKRVWSVGAAWATPRRVRYR